MVSATVIMQIHCRRKRRSSRSVVRVNTACVGVGVGVGEREILRPPRILRASLYPCAIPPEDICPYTGSVSFNESHKALSGSYLRRYTARVLWLRDGDAVRGYGPGGRWYALRERSINNWSDEPDNGRLHRPNHRFSMFVNLPGFGLAPVELGLTLSQLALSIPRQDTVKVSLLAMVTTSGTTC